MKTPAWWHFGHAKAPFTKLFFSGVGFAYKLPYPSNCRNLSPDHYVYQKMRYLGYLKFKGLDDEDKREKYYAMMPWLKALTDWWNKNQRRVKDMVWNHWLQRVKEEAGEN